MADRAVTDRAPDDNQGAKADTSDDAFLRRARKRFDRCASSEVDNRTQAVEDLKFKQGDQWPAQIKSDRTIQKRPCLTINKIPTFIHQVTNDQRQNRPSINVTPIGDKSDKETAKMMQGLIRQIERLSSAEIAYDTAFESAVSIGWGYWRTITEYEDTDTFDQVIHVQRIRNPFRVYLDPDHQEPDGADMQYAFITDLLTRDEFAAQFPNADPMGWEEIGRGDEYKNWATQTHIRIAEYFCYEYTDRKLIKLENGHEGYEDELAEDVKANIELNPALVVGRRDVRDRKVKWYKITGTQILDETDWPGKWIPIVKVLGDETDVDGKVTLQGIIRAAKDPQRQYNYWTTAETELIALQPKAPWVMEEGQVEGHENKWKDSNNKSYPYLLYKGTSIAGKPAPPPQRQAFTGSPQGVVQAKIAASQDMQAVTGIRFDATQQERAYDESGKALRELRSATDLGNFHYIDNLARSLRQQGRIFIDLIPKVYDTRRVVTILREDDSEEQVVIDPSIAVPHKQEPDQLTGKVKRLYNPKLGSYEVMVNIGPAYATKRAEAAESMLAFIKAVPNAAGLVDDLVAKNMDWPGADEFATRLASNKPPNLLNKSVSDFPPQAKALINSLQTQLQQLGEQHKQALAMLGEKDKDRALVSEKIEKDYDAKLLKIIADLETKMAATEAKLADTLEKRISTIVNAVTSLESKLTEKKEEKQDSGTVRSSDLNHIGELAKGVHAMAKAVAAPRRNRIERDAEGNALHSVSEIIPGH